MVDNWVPWVRLAEGCYKVLILGSAYPKGRRWQKSEEEMTSDAVPPALDL